MAARPAHAKTPSLNSEGLPDGDGKTRDVGGQLQYLNPMTDRWEPAVRLADIRQRVLQGNRQSYTIPKKHGNSHGREPLNYTSFLPQDQPYGPSRADRNPVLFQLKPVDLGAEPTGYVMDNGSIVLDAYNHGIRDFGNAMPLCLSTEVEGHDIETYKRRNTKIAMYDLIARMPRDYWTGKRGETWRPKPPRPGSVSMRATRFRLRAGCLTWNGKGDSDAKNSAMMSLMPSAVRTICETNNSTTSFRDLSKAEQTQCETAKGQRPAKASKTNRAKKIEESQEDSAEDGGIGQDEDAGANEDEDQEEPEDGIDMDQEEDVGANENEDSEEEGDATQPATRLFAKRTRREGIGHSLTPNKTVMHDSSTTNSKGQQPKQGRKRSRKEASFPEDSDDVAQQAPTKHRRKRKQENSDESGSEYEPALVDQPLVRWTSRKVRRHIQTSRADAESASAFGEAIAHTMRDPQSTSNVEDTHDLGYLFDDDEQDAESEPQMQTSMTLTHGPLLNGMEPGHSSEDSEKKGVVLNVKRGSRLPERHSNSDSSASDEFEHLVDREEIQDADTSEEANPVPASRKITKATKRSAVRKGSANTKLADTMRSATRRDGSLEAINTTTFDRRKLKQAIRREAQNSAPYTTHEQHCQPQALSTFADASQAPSPLDFGGELPYFSLEGSLLPAPHPSATYTSQIPGNLDFDSAASYLDAQETLLSEAPLSDTDVHESLEGFDPITSTYAANFHRADEHAEGFVPDAEDAASTSYQTQSADVDFDPDCEEFQDEVAAGVKAGDYRYVSPMGPDDIKIIDRVLELSRADFHHKTGHRVPENIKNGYKGETYASQQRRLDALFENERIEAENNDGESIYSLPEWFGGFNSSAWRKALDEEGTRLEDVTQDYDF